MQVHKTADGRICYFSRRAIEHGERSNYSIMDELLRRCIAPTTAILDGELIVWNKAK
jgi:hypothetical protein